MDAQEAQEKMLNIPDHPGNAKQNYSVYHLTPVRVAIMKKHKWQILARMEERELSYTVGGSGNVNWYSHLENSMEVSKKKLKIELP